MRHLVRDTLISLGIIGGGVVVGLTMRSCRSLDAQEPSFVITNNTLEPAAAAKIKFDDLLPTNEVSSVRHTDDGAIVLSVEKLYIWDPIVCDGVLDFQLRRPTSDEPTTETAALDAPEVLYE